MTLEQATSRALDMLEPVIGRDRIAETRTTNGQQIAWRERDRWTIAFDLEDDTDREHDITILVRVGDPDDQR